MKKDNPGLKYIWQDISREIIITGLAIVISDLTHSTR